MKPVISVGFLSAGKCLLWHIFSSMLLYVEQKSHKQVIGFIIIFMICKCCAILFYF